MYLKLHSIARPKPDANLLLYGCEVSAFSVGQLTLPLVRWARANVFGLRAFARVIGVRFFFFDLVIAEGLENKFCIVVLIVYLCYTLTN